MPCHSHITWDNRSWLEKELEKKEPTPFLNLKEKELGRLNVFYDKITEYFKIPKKDLSLVTENLDDFLTKEICEISHNHILPPISEVDDKVFRQMLFWLDLHLLMDKWNIYGRELLDFYFAMEDEVKENNL